MLKRFRLRHYKDCLEVLPEVFTGGRREFALLLGVWGEFRISDLARPTLEQRIGTQLQVVFPRLPLLVHELHAVNQLFLKDQDLQVESRMRQWLKERVPTSLDLYLTSEEDVPIETGYYLRRLQGLLWQHHYLLAKEEGEWRYRLSTPLYGDLATLARVLVF